MNDYILAFEGSIEPVESIHCISCTTQINVRIHNNSNEKWHTKEYDSDFLSYHWLDDDWKMLVFEGERTRLPKSGVSSIPVDTTLQIRPPEENGDYILVVTLVREGVGWFESSSKFKPLILRVKVDKKWPCNLSTVGPTDLVLRRSEENPPDVSYALLCYNTTNIGDEIQSLAALQFLPRVDLQIDRDNINNFQLSRRTKLILNGWFTHHPQNWPPKNDFLDPLLVSFHISNEHGSNERILLNEESSAFYEKHSPIGSRDRNTLRLLRERRLDAFYSCCLTLTLRAPKRKRTDKIVFVDTPAALESLVPPEWRTRILNLTHHQPEPRGPWGRLYLAQSFLDIYSTAQVVVTSRLHCALPCLAFDTPVVFIPPDVLDVRFSGIKDLFMHFYDFDSLMSGETVIDWHKIGTSTAGLAPLKERLIHICQTFTGKNLYT